MRSETSKSDAAAEETHPNILVRDQLLDALAHILLGKVEDLEYAIGQTCVREKRAEEMVQSRY